MADAQANRANMKAAPSLLSGGNIGLPDAVRILRL
jgi:hypothetical protein